MKYRVALITKLGKNYVQSFSTRDEVDTFILSYEVKKYRILDLETNEIIETEKGKR